MKKYVLYIYLLLIFGCTPKENKPVAILNEKKTPESLQNNKSRTPLGSISKRYKDDIIDQLYQEALEKDPELKKLDKRINKIRHITRDSLKALNQYKKNNDEYWRTADAYINRIQDSITRESIRKIYQNSQATYVKSIAKIDHKTDSIQLKSQQLIDQHIVMKLFITQAMIQNYQKNEKPQEIPLDYLNKTHKQLLKETKKYTTFHK